MITELRPLPAWTARAAHMHAVALRVCLALSLLVAGPARIGAQVGATTDIITGAVTTRDGTPVPGAQVQVTSAETGVTRTKTTNARGQYTLLFPDGGGAYRISVRALGFGAQTATIVRQADEDRLVADFHLSNVVTQLSAVTVRAERKDPRRRGNDEKETPGSSGRSLSGDQMQRLPIDPTDLAAIAALSPGVVGLTATDTSAGAFSVAGQRTDQNQVTLDGLSFGAGSVPQEAVRNTRVVTNTYDVARGQFTGGLVQTTTRGGTNDLTGSWSYALRAPQLEFTGAPEQTSAFAEYTQHALSGGLGGPLQRDKVFYFGAAQFRRRLNPLESLLGANAFTLERLGTSPDSAARFLGLLAGYGLPSSVAAVPDDRSSDDFSALARVDYQIGQDHSLTVRGNLQGVRQNGVRTSALTVPSYGGAQSSFRGGGMVSLSSVFGFVLNELRASYARDESDGDPYMALPAGTVRVSSALDVATARAAAGVTTLAFGGNPALPTAGSGSQLEITNETSLLSFSGHRYKLGTLLNYSTFSSLATANRAGSYTFNSLADFAANRPAQFTRTVTPRARDGAALNAALYLGDTWRRGQALQLTYGLRGEYSRYFDTPDYNADVDRLFGLRTDQFPTEWRVSPRVGFTWTPGSAAQPERKGDDRGGERGDDRAGSDRGGDRGGESKDGHSKEGGFGGFSDRGGPGGRSAWVIRGGIGEFRGRAPTQLFAGAVDATGLPNGQQQLVCIGDDVPTPDWAAYLADPSTIPTSCAYGLGAGTGSDGTGVTQRPSVTVLDPAFVAPRAWRASIGVQRRLTDRVTASVDASYALGQALYGARDLNLVGAPAFSVGDEGGRPVFVPATSIIAATGATSVLASRLHPEYAQVVEATSVLASHTAQFTATVGGTTLRSLLWSLSYTLMRSTDQSAFAAGFGGGGGGRDGDRGGSLTTGAGTTAGNPNAVEWGTSDLERRHAIVGSGTWMARPWLELTSVVRVVSGMPYTPRVGGDINGDGARNDRAFVFDPATAGDTEMANGMARLLADAPASVRRCLSSQLGSMADRNSCSSAWTPSIDFQANLRPDLGGAIGRRLTLNVSFVNSLAGLDRLLHGTSGLRGWGQQSRPDATLLYVRGFDPANQRFLYEVNQLFGDQRGARTAIVNPFQIGIQGRFEIGPTGRMR